MKKEDFLNVPDETYLHFTFKDRKEKLSFHPYMAKLTPDSEPQRIIIIAAESYHITPVLVISEIGETSFKYFHWDYFGNRQNGILKYDDLKLWEETPAPNQVTNS